jgi:hypothetical protein
MHLPLLESVSARALHSSGEGYSPHYVPCVDFEMLSPVFGKTPGEIRRLQMTSKPSATGARRVITPPECLLARRPFPGQSARIHAPARSEGRGRCPRSIPAVTETISFADRSNDRGVRVKPSCVDRSHRFSCRVEDEGCPCRSEPRASSRRLPSPRHGNSAFPGRDRNRGSRRHTRRREGTS